MLVSEQQGGVVSDQGLIKSFGSCCPLSQRDRGRDSYRQTTRKDHSCIYSCRQLFVSSLRWMTLLGVDTKGYVKGTRVRVEGCVGGCIERHISSVFCGIITLKVARVVKESLTMAPSYALQRSGRLQRTDN